MISIGPADATAITLSCASLESRIDNCLSFAGLPRLYQKIGHLIGVVVVLLLFLSLLYYHVFDII